jgi:branched-chain amino acid transport system permease protein
MTHKSTVAAGRATASVLDHPLHGRAALVLLAVLAVFPWVASATGNEFYIALASRMLIFAMAATSLNLVLGFGGMVCFGQAAFVGVGAYVVSILLQEGVTSAWLAWPLAVGATALVALVVGFISLRTQGVYFIMITLAFAQMLYYLVTSLKAYGGDDGLSLMARSSFGLGLDLAHDKTFYYLTLLVASLSFYGVWRLVNARFGHVLQAIRENETRVVAIGYSPLRYKLSAFVLSGALAGLSGVLLANLGGFVSPSMMHWSQSGMLMIMVILGGVGYLWGGVVGAVVFLALEEVLGHFTIHWQLGLGIVLLAIVFAAPKGLAGLVRGGKAA